MIEFKNHYLEKDDYMIGYTVKNNEFYFDKEDLPLVSQHYWSINSHGVVTIIEDKMVTMHHFLLGNGIYKHVNGNKRDNRRSNLAPARGFRNDGKCFARNYCVVYAPEYEHTWVGGDIFEHIMVAEQMLGRPLRKGECVHHIDGNKSNNDPSNLMVFASISDHTKFHRGHECKKLPDGTFVAIDRDDGVQRRKISTGEKDSEYVYSYKDLCPICNKNYKSPNAKMCKECWEKERIKNIPSKEELEKLIISYPMTQVGSMYGVTDNAIRKWCKKYELPFRRKDIEEYKKQNWN